jgi:hypothetical protein
MFHELVGYRDVKISEHPVAAVRTVFFPAAWVTIRITSASPHPRHDVYPGAMTRSL